MFTINLKRLGVIFHCFVFYKDLFDIFCGRILRYNVPQVVKVHPDRFLDLGAEVLLVRSLAFSSSLWIPPGGSVIFRTRRLIVNRGDYTTDKMWVQCLFRVARATEGVVKTAD